MADLSSASFTAVNDVETAQGAPVSESLAQKYGSNENNLNSRMTTAESGIATLESDTDDLIDFVQVVATTTSLGVKTTLYTVPANRRALVQMALQNLPDSTGSLGCTVFITQAGFEVSFSAADISGATAGWKNNGETTSATGTYFRAQYMSGLHLVAGDTIKITRTDRGAVGLNIVEFKELT